MVSLSGNWLAYPLKRVMSNRKLIFVYNADSGFFNTVSDIAHKITSPETYQCQLCALTHGYFKIKDQWQQFINTTEDEFVFYHRDEFVKEYGTPTEPLPAIFQVTENGMTVFVSREQLAELSDVSELVELMNKQ